MSIKSGFITSNTEIEVKCEDYLDFIDEFINTYIKTPSNEIIYNDFIKSYKGLNPKYEFMIYVLKMINISTIIDFNNLYYPRQDGLGMMRLTKSEYSKKDYEWLVNNSLNSTLQLSNKMTNGTNSKYSLILPNGKYLSSNSIRTGALAHMYLLNLLSFNKELYESYHEINDCYNYHDYLINRLGIVNKELDTLEYNPKLVTLKQMKLIEDYNQLGCRILEYKVNDKIEYSKQLIKTIRYEV